MHAQLVLLTMASAGRKAAIRRFGQQHERALVAAVAVVGAVFAGVLSHGDAAIIFGALGVPALVYATIQFGDAKRTIRTVETIGDELRRSTGRVEDLHGELSSSTKRLEAQLSTRQLGVFPKFLPDIVDLLKPAEKSILIFCDFPAYGELSNLAAYEEYAEVVQDKGRLVNLLCLGEDERRVLTEEQFDEASWAIWPSLNADKLGKYLETRKPHSTPETIDYHEFLDILNAGDTHALENAFAAAEKWETKLVMPLYFWIVDDRKAVFALAPFLEEAREVGFQTSDEDMIGALKGIFDRYKVVKSQTQSI